MSIIYLDMNIAGNRRLTRSRSNKTRLNSSQDQNTISCPNFSNDFLSTLHGFYIKKLFCDVVVTNEACRIHSHKVVLVAHSQFFKSLLEQNPDSTVFTVPNSLSSKTLESILLYMYIGSFIINSPSDAISLLNAASNLQILSAVALLQVYSANHDMKPYLNMLHNDINGTSVIAIKVEQDELIENCFVSKKQKNYKRKQNANVTKRSRNQTLKQNNLTKENLSSSDSNLKKKILNYWMKRDDLYTCENCEKGFKFRTALNFHKVSVHKCSTFIGHVETSQRLVKRSRTVRHNLQFLKEVAELEDVDQNYSCLKCWKTFNSRTNCLHHISLHFQSIRCTSLRGLKPPNFGKTSLSNRFLPSSTGTENTDASSGESSGSMKCLKCTGKKFFNEKLLLDHMMTSHPQVMHSCQHCPFKTRLHHVFERHQLACHKKRKTCPVCGKSCARSESLNVHMLLIHKIQNSNIAHKLHRCSEPGCGYVCLYKKRVEEHAKKHKEKKDHKCNTCGKMFKHERGLDRHKLVIHEGVRPYICDICGQAYGQEGELKMHIARHDSNKPHTCHLCSYSTQYKANLQSHLFKIHQVISNQKMLVFSCDKCPYITNRRSRFNDHVKKKHNNIVDIPCPECDKMFSTKQNLYGHVTAVHGPKTFQCNYCSYSTGVSTTLKQHIKVMHTQRDVKNYECILCGFRSATSGNCRKHIQRLHMNSQVAPKYVGIPRDRNQQKSNNVVQ